MSVLAERHGKFNAASSTDLSRLEDTLTNAVFGGLRYLPAEVALAAFFRSVGVSGVSDWAAAKVELWPRLSSTRTQSGFVEPDVGITAGDVLLCVEAKYRSGFGWYPREEATQPPLHQLAVQAEALVHAAEPGQRVLLVALTDSSSPPTQDLHLAAQQLLELGVPAGSVTLAWTGWHRVGKLLQELEGLNAHECTLRDDIIDYLTWRKVLSVFEPIAPADWVVLGQAAEASAQRVFPAVAAFQRSLSQALDAEGIVWGNPNSGVNLFTTTSLNKEAEWLHGRVSLPWWPVAWGERRAGKGFGSGLYTCFDFKAGALEVGFAVSAPSVAEANATWLPRAVVLAHQLGAVSAPPGLQLALAEHVLAPRREVVELAGADPAWFAGALRNLGGCLLLRTILPMDASVNDAQQALLAVRAVVDSCPELLALIPRPT